MYWTNTPFLISEIICCNPVPCNSSLFKDKFWWKRPSKQNQPPVDSIESLLAEYWQVDELVDPHLPVGRPRDVGQDRKHLEGGRFRIKKLQSIEVRRWGFPKASLTSLWIHLLLADVDLVLHLEHVEHLPVRQLAPSGTVEPENKRQSISSEWLALSKRLHCSKKGRNQHFWSCLKVLSWS